MYLLARAVVQLIARPLYFLYTLPIRVRDRVDISLHKKHVYRKIITVDQGLTDGGKYVIFAVYPRMELLGSVLRIRSLVKSFGFNSIFVINENSKSSKWISQFEDLGDTIILRRNIGHDFGAYQSGIEFLISKGLMDNCQQLVLLNDSAVYTPRSEKLLGSIFENTQPWQSLTFSTEPEFHSQSYFLSFTSEILKSEVFRKFWREYYPSSLRHLVIRKGEIGLSRALLASGWLPRALTQNRESGLINPTKSPLKLEERIALFSDSLDFLGVESISEELVANRVFHEIYESNPSQTLGPYLARTAGFPLKRDLLYARLYSLRDILNCLEECGITGREHDELRELFLSTLVIKSGRLNSLWRRFGLAR